MRKVVTCLFADLVGFTARAESLDPEDVEAILRPYHERLRSELERYGGTVEKFIGDAVMALFGAPTAHEDDPERAVRAALAIRDWARDEGELEVRIGITTGGALVLLGAQPEAGVGMASGDVVNTASRLQAAAPANGILVDEGTYRATQRAIEYGDVEPIEAKGKAEPVPVWEPLEGRARIGAEVALPQTPLVGREQERGLLTSALDRARNERAPSSSSPSWASPASERVPTALAGYVRVLLAAGRSAEADALVTEMFENGLSEAQYASADLAVALVDLDRGNDLPAVADLSPQPHAWLDAAKAVTTGDYLGAADLYARIDSLPDEADARLRSGIESEVGGALEFYGSVGATRYIREGEALLAASA